MARQQLQFLTLSKSFNFKSLLTERSSTMNANSVLDSVRNKSMVSKSGFMNTQTMRKSNVNHAKKISKIGGEIEEH